MYTAGSQDLVSSTWLCNHRTHHHDGESEVGVRLEGRVGEVPRALTYRGRDDDVGDDGAGGSRARAVGVESARGRSLSGVTHVVEYRRVGSTALASQ